MRKTPITAEEIMSWGPCPDWPYERVAAYVGKGMTPQAFLECDLAPREIEWLLIRREVLDNDSELAAIVGYCPAAAEQALSRREPVASETNGLSDLQAQTGLDTVLESETSAQTPVERRVNLEALAAWPDPLGALSEAKRVSETLTVDALRLYLAALR